MYHYLANVLEWGRVKVDELASRGDAPKGATETARTARLTQNEKAQRVLQERQRAYTDFMTHTSLGRLLADYMPADEGVFAAAAPAVFQPSEDVDRYASSTSSSLSHEGEPQACGEAGLARTELEVVMIEALAPLLSCKTAVVTRRVLELVPQPAPVAPGPVCGEQGSSSPPQGSLQAVQKSLLTLEEAQEAQLPFLLVVVHLQHWQSCLTSLCAALSAEAASSRDSATTVSVRVVESLQQLSHVLVAITCATDLQAAAMRSHLNLLSNAVTSCVVTTLRCLSHLTRAGRSEEFSLPPATAPAASLPEPEWIRGGGRTARGCGEGGGMSTRDAVSAEVIEKQGYRLLSLCLYWMELLHDISTPSLSVQELFLTASTARLNAHGVTVAKTEREAAAAVEETRRCTGLSNAVLVHEVNATPSEVPLAMLSLGVRGAKDGNGEGKSANVGLSLALGSANDVAESLIALLFFASKGAVDHAPPRSETHTVMVEGEVVEEDSDLGLIVVLTARLLRHMFITSASSSSAQVGSVAGVLLSAISVLLACFIAGDRKTSDLCDSSERTGALQSATSQDRGAQPHFGTSPILSPPSPSPPLPPPPPPPPTGRCDIDRALTPPEHPWRPIRQLRLLGQLSCGLVLLTTLMEENAISVVEAMDHSFVLDALITVLQVVGSRFTEPSWHGVTAMRAPDVQSRQGAEAWGDWVRGVERIASSSTALESLSALLNQALARPPQITSAPLSSNPYVDEFLHAYLGLLVVARLVRASLSACSAPPSRGTSLGRNSAVTATNGASARQRRALDTLDQLELTVVKTFLIADSASALHPTSSLTEPNEFPTTPPLSPTQESGSSDDTDVRRGSRDMSHSHGLTFPFESCLYDLLLKHALWCLEAHGQHRSQSIFLLPRETPAVQRQQPPFAPPSLGYCTSPAMLALSSGFSASTRRGTPLLAAQAPRTNMRLSPPCSPSNPPLANPPQSAAATSPGHIGFAPVTTAATGDDDSFVLFLVHHGLFRILLHDEHFSPHFTSLESTAPVETACSPRRRSYEEEATVEATTTWRRPHLVLYLLSHCLQLCACDGGSGDSEEGHQPPGAQDGRSPASVTGSQHGVASTCKRKGTHSTDEQHLARETVGALMRVLRASSASVLPPCSSVVHSQRRRWCNCLVALASLAAAPPQGVNAKATTSGVAGAVCAALVQAGGVEYLLRAAAVSADACPEVKDTSPVSWAWAMQAARSLVRDAAACVYMATNCPSLLLSLLWHPLLRQDGQQMVEALLCQPLVDLQPAIGAHLRRMEPLVSTMLSTGHIRGEGSPGAVQAVPLHCQRLCEGVWRTLCECVNYPTLGGGGFKLPDSIAPGMRPLSAASADEETRQIVLRSLLNALECTFRRLCEVNCSDADGNSCELLRLRTFQRALFEASQSDELHIYGLLLHLLTPSREAVGGHDALSNCSLMEEAGAAEAKLLTSSPKTFLVAASDLPSVQNTPSGPLTAAARHDVEACRAAREMVRSIARVLVGMTLANPSQREMLYRVVINEEGLVNCIANAWAMANSSSALPPTRSLGEDDACGMVRVCSYLIYESVDTVDAFFDEFDEVDVAGATPWRRDGVCDEPWTLSLQNPLLLAAVLRRFTCLAVLTGAQQAALRQLLVSIIRTVESCYGSLYLAASSAVHDVLGQLLPVVARLPQSAASQVSPSSKSGPVHPRLDALLVHLLVLLARCHMDVRQLKQLLMLISHSRHQRDRQALVPLIIQVLSGAVQPPLGVPFGHAMCRDPQHFIALYRGRGPAGLRAALPDFPLEGYSVSLNVRWEGMPTPQSAGGGVRPHQRESCVCLFSLRTADRATLLAFMVEGRTGRFFVQYRNRQQQELRVYLAATLRPREWTHLCVSHRPAAFLTPASGGQFMLYVNNAEVAVIPQVAYPLMSRGFFYVGCLGHDVDRLSVAHAFYGQVSAAYFFPYTVTERDRGVLQTAVRLAEAVVWTSSSSTITTPSPRPLSFSPDSHRAPSTTGGTAGVAGDEHWLAGRATVCVDTRLSDRGHLCNLSAVLRGRTGRDSRLFTMEGSLVCSKQRVIDSMGVLGALPSVLMPLCILMVNPTLPISFRGLVVPAQVANPANGGSHLPPPSSFDPTYSTGTVFSGCRASDTINITMLRLLDLVPPLACAETIRNEMAEAGFFVFLGQVLELLGPVLQVAVPVAFVKLLEALAPFPRLFEDALTNLFFSADVIRAAPREVQLTWVKVQRTFLSAHPDTLPCLRTLGACMFVAEELLRVTAEEASEESAQEDTLLSVQQSVIVTRESLSSSLPTSSPISVCASDISETSSSSSSLLPASLPSHLLSTPPSCSLQDLESQWIAYFEALIVAPVALGDVEALQYLVEKLHLVCRKTSIQLRLLRRVRRLLVASATPYLFQLLGRKNYVVSLMPYLTSTTSEAVRLEALLQLLFMVFHSKRTQELMNPILLASKDTVVHVAEEVSLSWLKDVLQQFPVNLPVYLALRCGLVGLFDVVALPTHYAPLDESQTIRFPAVLLPLLMLMKRSADTKLKEFVLIDTAVLLKSDPQAWRRVITVRGWYVSVVGFFASSLEPTCVPQETSVASPVGSRPVTVDSAESEGAQSKRSGLFFTTVSMILSYTIYQVLWHETYGAAELELVVTYLREQRLHRLLHQVLCGVADRYHSRLMALPGGEQRGGAVSNAGSPASAFIGFGSETAAVNLCHFLRVVETVLFYGGLVSRCEATVMATVQPAVWPFTPPGPVPGGEGVVTHLPIRLGYTEWEELTLVQAEDDLLCGVAGRDVFYAGEIDDPHGNVRRALLRDPDGRWLHLPLAVKCAELLCSHSALLHLGSNGNTGGLSIGGSGSIVGSKSGGSGGPGDLLWSVLLGAAPPSTSVNGPIVTKASGVGGLGVGVGSGGSTAAVLKGGMLRLFGRLFKVLCQMTLRSGAALNSVVKLTDAFLRRIDREQRGRGFLLLKRAVNAEHAREHSPIAITMTLIYSVHSLLLRRLHAAECGDTSTHSNANAVLVDRLKSLVQVFRFSFEQLPAFASAAGGSSDALLHASRQPSFRPATRRLTRGDPQYSNHVGRGGSTGGARVSLTYLDDLTGEVFTAGVPTLQWLCDHQANPRHTVEAFAEVASREDYNAFAERCLLAVEREQLADKALAQELWPTQQASLRRLQELFAENSVARRLVHDKIRALMCASNSPETTVLKGETESGTAGPARDEHVSVHSDDLTSASFTSVFLPSAARRATAAARASTWTRFTVALRGTLWSADAGGLHKTPKYLKLSSQEQQCLVHRKLIYDRDGTNYSGRAMVSSSAPRFRQRDDMWSAKMTSTRAATALLRDGGDGCVDIAGGGSRSNSASCASHRRFPAGGSALLQASNDDDDDDDTGLEEDMMNFSLDGRGVSTATAASLSEYPLSREGTATLSKRANPLPSSTTDDVSATPSILSVPCEVPYLMHCWSGSFTVRGSEVIVLIDDVNKAYNQPVAEEAKVYVLRPRPFSVHLSHITQIAPARRFRMCRTALEIWTRDRRSCFVNFADTVTMNAAVQMIRCGERSSYMFVAPSFVRDTSRAGTAMLPALLREGAGDVSRHSAYVLQENPRREPLRLRATALWRNRLLSNFDYLLMLNLLAGRTLNDLTQYPVFPWILSDYTSETLDLTNPSIFRDLSMPMGACGSGDRQELVRQRYMEMGDLGDAPAHYLTHYSSPAITLYFLIRLPPFTGLSILLQGGHFDHADRMFHSIQASFKAVMTSTQDVRELIPELYYLPELCLNVNRVDFGLRQDRSPMHDLQLPPWAHNDPFTFVYRMREALESAHVSAHLHEWIDLIFGYKQRGKDAVHALNVFNWHSYEDLDRNQGATHTNEQLLVDSLDNIGQTPVQLFRRPHQPRLPSEWADPLQLPVHIKVMTLRWGCARVARTAVISTDRVLVVSGSGAAASLRMHLNLIRQSSVPPCAAPTSAADAQANAAVTHASSHANANVAAGSGHSMPPVSVTPTVDCCSFDVSEEYERRLAPIPAGFIPNDSPYADGSCTEASTALLSYDKEVFLVLGGFFDNSVMIRALSCASGDVRLRAHRGRVVVVASSEDSRYLVTGAEDTTFAVWSCQLYQQLKVELLFTIYSHEGMPSAVDVGSTLDVVATASLNGTLMLHSLSTGQLDRVIRHPYGAPIHRVLLQTTCYVPNIVFLSHQDYKVYQYSLNGAALRTFSPPGRVTTWATTASQCLLLACQPLATTGTSSGASATGHEPHSADHASCIVYLHSFFLEKLKTVPVQVEDTVSSLSAHPTDLQVVVAGTESGRLLLLRSVLA
ncbi:hypothetical protein JKF63_00163 [Porcisia hertigi]|uniref:Neurobeachin/beige protein n=1 Tax=Porcisia hertigi TaxID=2761500 RepID=A0A836HEL7_9TRYP|nr:hypothetical protein JKF63_00163 [Porcisia hertigi]